MTAKRRSQIGAMAAAAMEADQGRPEVGTTAMRSAPVRVTLDLDPYQHRQLTEWCTAAAELDRPSIKAAPVLRVLLDLLVSDPELSARVRKAVTQ